MVTAANLLQYVLRSLEKVYHSSPLPEDSSDYRCMELILSRNRGNKISKHNNRTEVDPTQTAPGSNV